MPLTDVEFRKLISGERRGSAAALLRSLLWLGSKGYACGSAIQQARYGLRLASTRRVPVPVVSVGNLTAGGTGKTPVVEWLARRFGELKVRVAIVSRGYGAQRGQQNDEARELAERLPETPHVQDRDRVRGAIAAVDRYGAQVVLLDDGFQHRRLARDFDLVLLDALNPFGYGHLLPRGLLREPPAALRRAHAVGITRADAISASDRQSLADTVRRLAPQALLLEWRHAPAALRSADNANAGGAPPLAALRNAAVLAFCGIGNPAGFLHTLKQCEMFTVGWREFPDHHRYTPASIAELDRWAADAVSATSTAAEGSPRAVICTHKDLVKVRRARLGPLPLYALQIRAQLAAGEPEFIAVLARLAEQALATKAAAAPTPAGPNSM